MTPLIHSGRGRSPRGQRLLLLHVVDLRGAKNCGGLAFPLVGISHEFKILSVQLCDFSELLMSDLLSRHPVGGGSSRLEIELGLVRIINVVVGASVGRGCVELAH